jgi:hypothetical protein
MLLVDCLFEFLNFFCNLQPVGIFPWLSCIGGLSTKCSITVDVHLPDIGQEKTMTRYRIITGYQIITRYSHTIIY